MIYETVFREAPAQWGLRGDPYLWDALGLWVCENADVSTFECHQVFEEFLWSGISIFCSCDARTERESIHLDWIPAGGMSGGFISLDAWRDTLIPTLVERSKVFQAEWSSFALYHPAKHRFRFAAWCASTAARSSRRICSFNVATGAELLGNSKLEYLAFGPHWLPDRENFDGDHEAWCQGILSHRSCPTGMTYGIAAKLVNCYTKCLFLSDSGGGWFEPNCTGWDQPYYWQIEALHPPIDSILLKALADENAGGKAAEWTQLYNRRWSNFSADDYKLAINLIKGVTGDKPWSIEALWPGFQVN